MKSRKIVLCGLFCAIGVLLPQVFHIFGQFAGTTFLPMHIPVFLAGLILGAIPGAIVGMIAPVLSTLFTGMPNTVNLPFMIIELLVYGVVSGLLMGRSHTLPRAYIALLGAQAAGRLAKALGLFVAAFLFQMDWLSWLTVWAYTLMGLPGILIQLIFIPPLYRKIQKAIHK